jgi:hypothetical protein
MRAQSSVTVLVTVHLHLVTKVKHVQKPFTYMFHTCPDLVWYLSRYVTNGLAYTACGNEDSFDPYHMYI